MNLSQQERHTEQRLPSTFTWAEVLNLAISNYTTLVMIVRLVSSSWHGFLMLLLR
jgi:hypothetical protein